MLKWRLISATVILAILLTLLHLDFHHPLRGISGLYLLPLILVISLLAALEMCDMLSSLSHPPRPSVAVVGTGLVVCGACVPVLWSLSGNSYPENCDVGRLGWPLLGLAATLLLAFLAEMVHYRQPGGALGRIASASLIVIYVGVLMALLVALRGVHDHRWGMAAVLSLLVVVKMSDTGAYFTGRLCGRHKLAPLLSPGKTWEGLIGGLLTGAVGGCLFFYLAVPWMIGTALPARPLNWLAYGLLLGLAGVVGDLAESLIKRDTGCKDSSRWMPGLGGVLDILDSVLAATPVALACWLSGLVGPATAGS